MIQAAGKKILFLSKDAQDASTRYRARQYFSDWRAAGWEPEHLSAHGGPIAKLGILRAALRADVVVVLRKLFPISYLHLLRRASKTLIFDLDDAVFCCSDGSPSATRCRRFVAMVSACDAVFAGNAYLQAWASRYNARVSLIPTALDVSRYVPATQQDDSGYLDLVWIGSKSTGKYLESSLPFLEHAVRSIPNLRLKIVSDFTLASDYLPIVSIPWSPDGETQALASAHIGIAPMVDTPWTRGKCALKVLQYMAAGLPVVSSSVGANAEAVVNGVSGFLLENEAASWSRALLQLAGDVAMRRRFGEAGRKIAASRYDQRVVFSQMSAALRDVLKWNVS